MQPICNRIATNMADINEHKIDRALVQLSQQYPRAGFMQKGDPGHFIQMTSTCEKGQPARFPLHTETEWTPMLYESMAQAHARLEDSSTGWHGKQKYIVGQISDLYGRGKTTPLHSDQSGSLQVGQRPTLGFTVNSILCQGCVG